MSSVCGGGGGGSYADSSINSLTENSNNTGGGQVVISLASAAPVAVTLEPSSLVLLGTGALATLGALRRRLRS